MPNSTRSRIGLDVDLYANSQSLTENAKKRTTLFRLYKTIMLGYQGYTRAEPIASHEAAKAKRDRRNSARLRASCKSLLLIHLASTGYYSIDPLCACALYYAWKSPRGNIKSFVRIRTSRYFDLRHIHIHNIHFSLMLKIIQWGSHMVSHASHVDNHDCRIRFRVSQNPPGITIPIEFLANLRSSTIRWSADQQLSSGT